MPTVREFLIQSYKLVTASNPNVPLNNHDQADGIQILNQLLDFYGATGLLLTIAKTITIPVVQGQMDVVCGPADFVPTPDITEGRLAAFGNAWLTLDGVDYPLIHKVRDDYLAAWKYNPLQGLPRFVIDFAETEVVRLRLYPAPSQTYIFNLRGKFQTQAITANSDMSALPAYYYRYFLFAVSKDLAMFKGRSEAWTPQLEKMLVEARDVMEAASEINVAINGDEQSLLNGAWRVKSGI